MKLEDINGQATVDAFNDIAKNLKSGANYDNYEAQINALLGTGMEPRDEAAEEAYESTRNLDRRSNGPAV